MKIQNFLLASSLIGFLSTGPSVAADNFFSECKGTQADAANSAPSLEIIYWFKTKSNGEYVGSAEYYNSSSNVTFGGRMQNFVITPENVSFTLIYEGGRANGDKVDVALKRNGNVLSGTGHSSFRDKTRIIELKCK